MIRIEDGDYVACLCEGHCEAAVMDLLLDDDLLSFDRGQLLEEAVLPTKFFRDPKLFCDRYLTMDYEGGKVVTLLVQDRKNAKYKIRQPYDEKVRETFYAITAPEIEMLMIHSLGLYDSYKKHSSKMKPSRFLSEELRKKTSEIKSTAFVRSFYAKHDLPSALKEHRRKSQKLGRGELFLADLLA